MTKTKRELELEKALKQLLEDVEDSDRLQVTQASVNRARRALELLPLK